MSDKKGFTLVEILIVVAVVAVIGTLAAIAVNAARSKQRDATRLANVREMQIVMEEFFNDNNQYPDGVDIPLGDPGSSACLGAEGFKSDCAGETTIYLRAVPSTVDNGLDDLVVCGSPPRNALCYTHLSERSAYGIEFELENAVPRAELVEGVNCATPNAIQAGTCPEPAQ